MKQQHVHNVIINRDWSHVQGNKKMKKKKQKEKNSGTHHATQTNIPKKSVTSDTQLNKNVFVSLAILNTVDFVETLTIDIQIDKTLTIEIS